MVIAVAERVGIKEGRMGGRGLGIIGGEKRAVLRLRSFFNGLKGGSEYMLIYQLHFLLLA